MLFFRLLNGHHMLMITGYTAATLPLEADFQQLHVDSHCKHHLPVCGRGSTKTQEHQTFNRSIRFLPLGQMWGPLSPSRTLRTPGGCLLNGEPLKVSPHGIWGSRILQDKNRNWGLRLTSRNKYDINDNLKAIQTFFLWTVNLLKKRKNVIATIWLFCAVSIFISFNQSVMLASPVIIDLV